MQSRLTAAQRHTVEDDLANHLLSAVPYRRLLKNIKFSEVEKTHALLHDFFMGESVRFCLPSWTTIASMAYALGVRQGVHQERARRKMRISASVDAPAQHVTTVELPRTAERIAATGCTLEQHIRLGLQEKREAVAP